MRSGTFTPVPAEGTRQALAMPLTRALLLCMRQSYRRTNTIDRYSKRNRSSDKKTLLWVQTVVLVAESSWGTGALRGSTSPSCRAKRLPRGAHPQGQGGDAAAAAAPRDAAGKPPQSRRLQAQQLLLHSPKYLICTVCLLLFFLMKKDFRSSAVDLELLKKIERIKAQY